jgi:hypothetical protein
MGSSLIEIYKEKRVDIIDKSVSQMLKLYENNKDSWIDLPIQLSPFLFICGCCSNGWLHTARMG